MTKHEKIAARNLRAAFNFEVGSTYNAYLDGDDINISIEEMKDYIYNCAMNDYRSLPGRSRAERNEVCGQGVLHELS